VGSSPYRPKSADYWLYFTFLRNSILSKIELTQVSAFFQLFIPGLTPGSVLESESRFEIVMQLIVGNRQPFSRLYSSKIYYLVVQEWGRSEITRKYWTNSNLSGRLEQGW
jgi:hypothetical protein